MSRNTEQTKEILASYDAQELVNELFERGVLMIAEQDVYLPSVVSNRAGVTSPQQVASARAVSDLMAFLLYKKAIDVRRVDLGNDAPPGDIKVAASIITVNPEYSHGS